MLTTLLKPDRLRLEDLANAFRGHLEGLNHLPAPQTESSKILNVAAVPQVGGFPGSTSYWSNMTRSQTSARIWPFSKTRLRHFF